MEEIDPVVVSAELGRRIASRRALLDMGQRELAAKLGVNIQAVSRLEQGQVRSMSFVRLRILATTLRTSLDYLLGLDDDGGSWPTTLALVGTMTPGWQ